MAMLMEESGSVRAAISWKRPRMPQQSPKMGLTPPSRGMRMRVLMSLFLRVFMRGFLEI